MNQLTWLLLIVVAALLAGCSPAASPVPDTRGPATPGYTVVGPLDMTGVTTQLLAMESYPVQYALMVRGELPTPCHRIEAAVDKPNARGEIHVTLTVSVPSEAVCAQVMAPFGLRVALGSYAQGRHPVFVNGVRVGEIG